MARNYAALPYEYLEEMDILSDAEFGRLCRALLAYSMDGREGRLEGAEKVLWKRVKNQEDRFKESYNELTESRKEAGKRGAAKRWQRIAKDGKAMASDGKAIAGDGKNGYTETKTKTETNIPPPVGGRDTAPARVSVPTFEQVLEVAKLNRCQELAKPFFDYYAASGWRDSEGRPVYSWQQKFQAWKMREQRLQKPEAPDRAKSWAELAAETEGGEPL